MIATQKSLLELTAADLQTQVVLTLPATMSLRDAAIKLSQARCHGAPVVDEAGRCVGVLSVSDVARGPCTCRVQRSATRVVAAIRRHIADSAETKRSSANWRREVSRQSQKRLLTASWYWSAGNLTVFSWNGKWLIRSRSRPRMSGTT
jgi:CBS domain-containing protein